MGAQLSMNGGVDLVMVLRRLAQLERQVEGLIDAQVALEMALGAAKRKAVLRGEKAVAGVVMPAPAPFVGPIGDIAAQVAVLTGVSVEAMCCPLRTKPLCMARAIVCRQTQLAGRRVADMAQFFNRDHSSILHSMTRVAVAFDYWADRGVSPQLLAAVAPSASFAKPSKNEEPTMAQPVAMRGAL